MMDKGVYAAPYLFEPKPDDTRARSERNSGSGGP